MSSRSSSRKSERSGERVQKVLANAGIASRREIDRLIQAGRVIVDGNAAVPGDRLMGEETVLVDGKRVRLPATAFVRQSSELLYHKPTGEITSRRDPEGRRTVFESLPRAPHGRWIAVGRLDINTSGLLIFTTDGELAHRLMHPRYEIERVYAVRVRGTLSDEQIGQLLSGVPLDEGYVRFDSVEPMHSGNANAWYEVRLSEGRNREIRRLFEAIGCAVSRLIRIRYGPLSLGRLKRGQYRILENTEREALRAAVQYGRAKGT